MYNYLKNEKENIKESLESGEYNYIIEDYEDLEDSFDALYDAMWLDDCITGNSSGSYTFDAQEAKENIIDNMDLLTEAAQNFGGDLKEYIKKGWEFCDVTIRCYLLGTALQKAIEEINV